jgi:hypothetical protein
MVFVFFFLNLKLWLIFYFELRILNEIQMLDYNALSITI